MSGTRALRQLPVALAAAGLTLATLTGAAAAAPTKATTPTTESGTTAACDNTVCLFGEPNFGGEPVDVGWPPSTCTTAPIPAQSVINNGFHNLALYSDTNCQNFSFWVDADRTAPTMPTAARSYRVFPCSAAC